MRIRVVDAFTDRPFGGNPAGVCLLDAWPAEDWMRAVAGEIMLDFPANPAVAHPAPDGLAAALGAVPEDVRWVPALRELFVVLGEERTVRALAPDLAAVARLDAVRGVVVTALAGADFDFVSRVFLPAAGIPEDPVTGGAHTAVAPYWAQRIGRDALVGYQASARGGIVRTRVRGDRVELSARALTVIDGDLLA